VRFAIAAALVAACYAPNAEVGAPCSPSGDCPSGQRCDDSQSPPTCVSSSALGSSDGDGGIVVDAPAVIDGLPVATDAGGAVTCNKDGDCDSGNCSQYAGTCVPIFDTIYVDGSSGHDGGACTQDAPCASITYAMSQIDGARRIVHVADGDYGESLSIDSGLGGSTDTVVVIGATDQGAELEGGGVSVHGADVRFENFGIDSAGSDAVSLDSGCTLVLAGVTITDAGNDGVKAADQHSNDVSIFFSAVTDSDNLGVHLKSGSLTMDADYIGGNTGGIELQNGCQASIQNTSVVGNGGASSTVGGIVTLDSSKLTSFTFNTVADNTTNGSRPGGVLCGMSASNDSFAANNSIFSGNTSPQTDCPTSYSLFGSDGDVGTGDGDIAGDPAFKDEMDGDFHITPASAARNAADPQATLDHDYDGQSRPQGPARDIGADEIQ
jgi:hypothetical protein